MPPSDEAEDRTLTGEADGMAFIDLARQHTAGRGGRRAAMRRASMPAVPLHRTV